MRKAMFFKMKEALFSVLPVAGIVLILVPREIKDNVLEALYHSSGLGSAGHGIAFSLPVDRTVGLS